MGCQALTLQLRPVTRWRVGVKWQSPWERKVLREWSRRANLSLIADLQVHPRRRLALPLMPPPTMLAHLSKINNSNSTWWWWCSCNNSRIRSSRSLTLTDKQPPQRSTTTLTPMWLPSRILTNSHLRTTLLPSCPLRSRWQVAWGRACNSTQSSSLLHQLLLSS